MPTTTTMTTTYENAGYAIRDAISRRPLDGSRWCTAIGWQQRRCRWAIYDPRLGMPDEPTTPEILVLTRHPEIAVLALSEEGEHILKELSPCSSS